MRGSLLPFLLLLIVLGTSSVFSQQAAETLDNSPESGFLFVPNIQIGFNFPLGDSTEYFGTGVGVTISGDVAFREISWLQLIAALGYGLYPIRAGLSFNQSYSVFLSYGGIGFIPAHSKFLRSEVEGGVGYYHGVWNGPQASFGGGGISIRSGAGVVFSLGERFALSVNGNYHWLSGFFSGATLSLSGSIRPKTQREKVVEKALPTQQGNSLELISYSIQDIFPVLRMYHDRMPVGRAVLQNKSDEPVSDVIVTFLVDEYMTRPKICAEIESIGAQEKVDVPLFALFSNSILEVTESTISSGEIAVEYMQNGRARTIQRSESLRIHDRNAITWDDTKKVAAFVTAKDPVILDLAKGVAAVVRTKGNNELNADLQTAITMLEAVENLGIQYVKDPTTPYSTYSTQGEVVDFLQFPRQTLQYGAGDCDDLSALFCALLESVGIKTAFITVPGHIYIAFSLGETVDRVRTYISHIDDLIEIEGDAWIPLEITAIGDSFLEAWSRGARTWRKYAPQSLAEIYTVEHCWTTYGPVGLFEESSVAFELDENMLERDIVTELQLLVNREIQPKIRSLDEKLSADPQNVRAMNKRGVVFARYGLYDRAETDFQKAMEIAEYVPALMNLAKLRYLSHDFENSLQLYEKVRKLDPGRIRALLGIALCLQELNHFEAASRAFAELAILDPDLAEKSAHIVSSAHADSSRGKTIPAISEVFQWQEE